MRELVDVLVVVDGAYRAFEQYNGTPESSDETLDVVHKLADVVIRCERTSLGSPVAWEDETIKRSKYLRGEPGDYYFVVDADEVIEGTIDREILATREDWLVEHSEDVRRHLKKDLHRLFAHRPGVEYRGAHHAVHVGGALIHPSRDVKAVFPGLHLIHIKSQRTQERSERKGRYYDWLVPHEKAARAVLGL